jgi:hypothetical protein
MLPLEVFCLSVPVVDNRDLRPLFVFLSSCSYIDCLQALADLHRIPFFETSAKDDSGVHGSCFSNSCLSLGLYLLFVS